MLGYTINDLNISDKNSLLKSAKDKSAKLYIEECINNHANVTFESEKKANNSISIWTQTSLTPIISDNKIYKIIFGIYLALHRFHNICAGATLFQILS